MQLLIDSFVSLCLDAGPMKAPVFPCCWLALFIALGAVGAADTNRSVNTNAVANTNANVATVVTAPAQTSTPSTSPTSSTSSNDDFTTKLRLVLLGAAAGAVASVIVGVLTNVILPRTKRRRLTNTVQGLRRRASRRICTVSNLQRWLLDHRERSPLYLC